jgi:hypothetical protein
MSDLCLNKTWFVKGYRQFQQYFSYIVAFRFISGVADKVYHTNLFNKHLTMSTNQTQLTTYVEIGTGCMMNKSMVSYDHDHDTNLYFRG